MEIKIPEVGESIYEAQITVWHKKDGDSVAKDELLCELETDKVSLELHAEASGILSIGVAAGETVNVGAVIGEIAESDSASDKAPAAQKETAKKPEKKSAPAAKTETAPKAEPEKKPEAPAPAPAPAKPAAAAPAPAPAVPSNYREEEITRQPMTRIRKTIASRLLAARQQTAMLTTFNEADMTRVLELKQRHRDDFSKRHGVKLGLMSFFVKACVEALQEFPEVNASIDGDDIILHHKQHIGIAIGAERGLVVPILRDAASMHFADIESAINDYSQQVSENKLALADLEGGTFTITNGGVYGSLLSTPILNPPQSAVLGMHAIQKRAVVIDDAIVIRPIMSLALSYDHRLIDGRQAVSFLKRIKELVEEPEEMLLEM